VEEVYQVRTTTINYHVHIQQCNKIIAEIKVKLIFKASFKKWSEALMLYQLIILKCAELVLRKMKPMT